jgi:hypothetical protein
MENFQRFSDSSRLRQKTLALLLLRDAQMKFEDQHSVAREMALEGTDVLETLLPNVLADDVRR